MQMSLAYDDSIKKHVISICRKRVPIQKQIVVIYAVVSIVLYWKRPHGS